MYNGLVAYKSASGNDWIDFIGGVICSVIAGVIAVVTFYYTIKNNNKNQKEAHDLQIKLNIKNNNLQTSLKVQDNLNRDRFKLGLLTNKREKAFCMVYLLYQLQKVIFYDGETEQTNPSDNY